MTRDVCRIETNLSLSSYAGFRRISKKSQIPHKRIKPTLKSPR